MKYAFDGKGYTDKLKLLVSEQPHERAKVRFQIQSKYDNNDSREVDLSLQDLRDLVAALETIIADSAAKV